MPSTTDDTPRCEFCGSALKPITMAAPSWMASEFPEGRMTVGHEDCDCHHARIAREREERNAAERERAQHRRWVIDESIKAGVRKRYIGATHPMADQVAKACADGRNVYIHGDVGAGKTTLASAAAIIMATGESFGTVRFCTTVELLDAIRASYKAKSSADPLMPYRLASVLILDDMGKESPSDWVVERLFSLINDRYNDLRPTVITTQFAPSDLVMRLAKNGGEENAVAIVSRLRSRADDSLLIRLDGEDMRMAKEVDDGTLRIFQPEC